MESFIDFNKVKDFFYSVPNINEATTDDDIPTPRLIYAALAKQTLEGQDMCSRMTEKLLAKLTNTSSPISAAVIYKTLLTIQYLLQYGHPDFYRALQDRYDPILVLMDWRGNSPADETPAMLIQEKASVLVEMLRSAHPVPLPSADTSSENANVSKGWTFTWPTLPSLPNFTSSPANTAQANSNLTSSGISSSVVSNAPWTLGSIWSIFSSNGQSSTITSTTTTTNNNNEPDRLSRYRPVQITPLPSSPSDLSFGPAKTNGFNPTWKSKTTINNNTNNNNFNQHSNNHSPASEVGNNNGDISGLFPTVYNNNHNNNSKESPKDKFNPKPEPMVSGPDPTSIFQLYYKKEYNAVENICQVLPTSLSRPTQSQIMEFLEIVNTLELGPVVFLLLQNLSNPDWLRKFRALIIIRELIAHNFPKVRDYFNEEGKSTLLSLSEDPHMQIKEQVSQLLKELSVQPSNPLPPRTEPQQTQLFPIISQESDHSQPNEVSLFASLEITKPNDHHNNDPLINTLTPQGQISETSLFDFIREDVNSEKKPNPHVLANPMEDPFYSSIPPPISNINTVVIPSPSVAVQEPIKSKPTPSSNLPASVFSALSQLPDATPNNSSPSDTLPPAHTTSKSLFTDMAAAAAANNTAKTTTTSSAFQTQPPYTLPNQLPNTGTPYPMYPYPYTNPATPYSYYYPPPMYPYPYTNPTTPVMPNPIPLNGQPSLFTNL